MAHDMCTRRLTRELHSLQKSPLTSPIITALPNESNILEWHYVIEGGPDTPYRGGYYHGKLLFPREYPLKPPGVIMLTPSGRFKPNRRLCLSMSDFHPESWNPMWSVSTILTGLYSFMIEDGATLGSVETSEGSKRRYARESLDFNARDGVFCKLFPELVEIGRKRREERGEVCVVESEGEEDLKAVMAAAAGVVALLSLLFAMRFF